MTRRLWLGAWALAIGACGATPPAAPAPAPGAIFAVQAGTWRGTLETVSCSGSMCSSNPETFVLRLNGLGDGVLQLDARPWSTAPPIAVDVRSTAQQSALIVTGSIAGSASGIGPLATDVRLDLTEVGDRLAGTLRYTMTRGSSLADKQARILTALRDTSAFASRFQGRWLGFGTRVECSGDCGFDAVLGSAGAVTLLLSQSGSALTGSFNLTAMTGTASGSTFTASARYQIPASSCQRGFDSGTVCLIELDVSGSVDSFDRMRGTLIYRVEGVDDRNRPQAMSGKGELTAVARWPFAF